MFGFLWEMRPYLRQVAGQLALGSVAGIIMNTAVVLPAILLGRAIDRALSLGRGEATAAEVGWAALAFVGGTLLTEGPRIGKRWWLMTANARIRANVRADAFRGVLAWPMADLQRTPLGDLMARIVGDVEVLGVGVREFTIEIWDTVLFSLSFVVALLVIDPGLTLLALSPVPLAMILAHATGRWVAGRTTRAREAIADLTSAIQEHLAGVRVLRLFGRASASVERVAALSRRFAERNLSVIRLKGGLQPVYTTLMTAGVLLIVWQGSERVIAGAMTVGASWPTRAVLTVRQPRPSDPPAGELPAERWGSICAVAATPRARPGRRGRAAACLIPCRTSGRRRASTAPHAGATRRTCRPLTARRDLSVPRRPGPGAARLESRHSSRCTDRRHGPGGLRQERADTGDPRHLSAGIGRGAHQCPVARRIAGE
jgi:hypothetical protein